jgi:hypothetical protein
MGPVYAKFMPKSCRPALLLCAVSKGAAIYTVLPAPGKAKPGQPTP